MIHDSCSLSNHGKELALRETAPCRYQPFFVGRWSLAEQPEIRMQWFAFVSLLQLKLN